MAVTEFDAPDAAEVPYVLVAVTVKVYATFDCNPRTWTGDDAPEPTKLPGDEVAVKNVAAFLGSAVNVILACPLLYDRFVPTFVAVPIVGAYGAKKSLAPWLILPACFDIYIFSLNPITLTGLQRPTIRLKFSLLLLLS